MVEYADFPALEKIHTSLGLAVLDRDSSAIMSALNVLKKDFSDFKNQEPRPYDSPLTAIAVYGNIPSRRLAGIETLVTYGNGFGKPEAGWVGLDLRMTDAQRALYKFFADHLKGTGRVTEDEKNDTERVKVGNEEYILDAPAHENTIFIKVLDLQKLPSSQN